MSTRGKTTPASTGGSFRAHAGEKSRATPDEGESLAGSRHPAVTAGMVYGNAETDGYTIQHFRNADNGRPLGLTLHTGHVPSRRTSGRKYGLAASGHHWLGTGGIIAASNRLSDIENTANRTYAFADSLTLQDDEALASMLVDTVNQTAVVRIRTESDTTDVRLGVEIQMHRQPGGDWEVDNVVSGTITRTDGEHTLSPADDDPNLDYRVTEAVEWFHRNINRIDGGQ